MDECTMMRLLPCFMLATASGTAFAQSVIERNLPEQATPPETSLTIDEPDYGQADAEPFGVDLAGVRLIGRDEAVGAAQPGISIGSVPYAADEPIREALSPFLGKPLSRALIVRMQSALAGVWREAGYPFVSVTVPPQEVTSGVVTLRVVEFSAGVVSVDAPGAVERNLAGRIRVVPGGRIDARELGEDLDWLNRNPYRLVEGIFAPGDETGASDLTLKVTRDKSYSVYNSWLNSGSEATGRDRWSLGGGVWLPALHDLTIAYRFTRSGEVGSDGSVLSLDKGKKGYLSHAARIDLPTLPRQSLSIAPNFVETNQFLGGTPFSFENKTVELPILYSSAVSNILPGSYWGDIYFGVEPKWARRKTYFAGIHVAEGEAELLNFVLGWSRDFSGSNGRTSIDARIKTSVHGPMSHDGDASWSDFTGGRVTDASYVYAGIDVTRLTVLPRGFSWTSRLSGLIAGQPLPDTERLGLGGYYAVRGYDIDDGAVDIGLVWRNEIRAPTLSPLSRRRAGWADRLSPFVFVDLGHGSDIDSRDHATAVSGGIGVDYQIGRTLFAGFAGAMALNDAGNTRDGDLTLDATVRVAF